MKKTETFNARLIAKYFIWKSQQEGKTITNKKLQKLLYYAQAWHLVFKDEPLFKEKIEAWIHGPAVRSIYGEYKAFGRDPITVKISEKDLTIITGETKEIIDAVWETYGKYDAGYLEILSHREAPWQKAREGIDVCTSSENEIKLQDMKDFYYAALQKFEQSSKTAK